eukprot:g767.t1
MWVKCDATKLPNIIHILADDLGWAELGAHRSDAEKGDVSTPNIDGVLKTEALELNRFYTHKICSPSRCSIQSGRAPIHVNVENVDVTVYNPKDNVTGYQGMPLNFTGIATKLKGVGYETAFVGKWDVGMATETHTPRGRGYDSFLGYFHHSNDYYTQKEGKCGKTSVYDLWRQNSTFDGPAKDLQNGAKCSHKNQKPDDNEPCVFEEEILTNEVKSVLQNHHSSGSDSPLFLFWSMHLVHYPLEVPDEWLEKFSFIKDNHRRKMHAMVSYMDNDIGEVFTLLKQLDMWNNTLIVFHSDNGGELIWGCAGNNFPLRGGKFSNFEGGIRVNAFVTGGVLPPSRRGQVESNYITSWDWYATYCHIAGNIDPVDHEAEAAGLPPVDSIDQYDILLNTQANSPPRKSGPRQQILIGDTSSVIPNGQGETLVGGLISGDYKLLVGPKTLDYLVSQNFIPGPEFPNRSSYNPIDHHYPPQTYSLRCTRNHTKGCLFNIQTDPGEYNNLAPTNPDLFYRMLNVIDTAEKTVYSPYRGKKAKQACDVAKANGNYWGPFV